MSDPPPGKQSKKSRRLRPFKDLLPKRSRSPSHRSVIPDNASVSISALPTNDSSSAPLVNPQGTEYAAILELSTTPSGQHRMREWGSTAYEGLKMAIQGIHDFSGSLPPLQTTAGVLLTISKAVDVCGFMCSMWINVHFARQRVSANRTDLEQLGVKLQSIHSIIGKYRENNGLSALDYRVEIFCLYVGSSFFPYLFDNPESSPGPSIFR
jgi:hypothetical protein